KPPEILPREQVLGVKERLGADGRVITPLAPAEISRVRGRVQELAPEAVAVCLLHAYAHPEHEELLAANLTDLGLPLSISSRVLPEIREYERTAATVLNAYLGPVLERYLSDWHRRLPGGSLYIQQSNGGFLPAAQAGTWGLQTVLSGPAGGVYGAWRLGQELGIGNLLTVDMGGTSTDVALLAGEIPFTREYLLEGYPLGIPVMDIHTVGAGGGSIAFKDRGGALRVGPKSAGADPGPVCYGRGEEITVTDAHLLLGRIRPENFLGGRMPLDTGAAERAMIRLAAAFGVGPAELALGVIRVSNSHMAKALRAVSLERGFDPREFTLCCFGGAAGLQVCELAWELDLKRILVPAQAGVLSAWGMALAGLRRDLTRTLLLSGTHLTWARLQEEFRTLREEGLAAIDREGWPTADLTLAGELELRYRGQSDTLNVTYLPDFLAQFHSRHRYLYGHDFPEREVEAVSLHLHLLAPGLPAPRRRLEPQSVSRVSLPHQGRVWLPEGPATIPFHDRRELEPGDAFSGPALVAEDYATLLILPGFTAEVLAQGHLLLSR
ncbi:MAG: hydantoinase/oxoprolinase family protein, partial [Syntrophales bacterium]|nr:hydantoinase/oxoprolinase family protein [Syntrophales bacterium]